jgi:hypothetical protein
VVAVPRRRMRRCVLFRQQTQSVVPPGHLLPFGVRITLRGRRGQPRSTCWHGSKHPLLLLHLLLHLLLLHLLLLHLHPMLHGSKWQRLSPLKRHPFSADQWADWTCCRDACCRDACCTCALCVC